MKNTKVLIAVIALCALIAIVVYVNSEGVDTAVPSQSPASTPSETSNAPPVEINEEQQNEKEVIVAPELDTTEHGLETTMREILLAADEFYDETKSTTVITQQNGKFYHGAAGIEVTVDYLIMREYLPEDYVVDGVDILYLSSTDVVAVIPSFTERESVFTLYIAASYDNGYLIYSRGESIEKITAEQYDNLLSLYNNDGGEITGITASSAEYAELNRLLKEYKQTDSDFYIRYGKRNDKYAVVVASPKNDYHKIYMNVFTLRDGKWEVRIPNLESVERAKSIVMNVCHDFDLALMPFYDVNIARGFMNNNPDDITVPLVNGGYLEHGESEIEYISMSNKLLFAKYENGRLFVGVNSGGTWILDEVDSAENAQNHFAQFDDRAPNLVIIWE